MNSDCSARKSKNIEHFVKTLKIKGLGPKTLEKLNLSSFADLFLLSKEYISDMIGSEKLAVKILLELENAAQAPANIVLAAFGIPLIGQSASEKLSTVCESIYDITEDSCKQAGLGPKATKNLITWLCKEFPTLEKELPFSYLFDKPKINNSIKGVVCLTGKLKTFPTKASAQKALEDAGYTIKSSLTKDVTILVNESGIPSAKTKKAEASGVRIITNINNLIGD